MVYLEIEQRLKAVVETVIPGADTSNVLVRPCPDPKFGDYQTNALMGIAKSLKRNPRQVAQEVLNKLDLHDLCEKVEIAGAGFLNFTLSSHAVANTLRSALQGKHLFFQRAAKTKRIVVDFSSPNVAKAMHVGHIRSTILGNSISRILRLLGHKVVTDNHIGDWGTQFGKLLVGWKREIDRAALARDPLGEMERIYKKVNAEFEGSDEVKEQARGELVKLQNGDPDNQAIWREMMELSLEQFDQIYKRLGVTFDHVLGESFYNPRLKGVVKQLGDSGLAEQSEGATIVAFPENEELKDHPAIILKKDGGANYTTTDLATLEYRIETWQPDEIVYVTDSRQQLHFKQFFAIFRKWKPEVQIRLSHVWFGMILGPDGTPFKTRTGENVKLADLLDEAEERALAVVTQKNPEAPEAERKEIARIVGIGAIKYSDLLPNRQSDYQFSWDKMLAMNGNTAVYLLYAYTRIRSIFRKASEGVELQPGEVTFANLSPHEAQLARHLFKFGLVLEAVAEEYRPNYLCNYLYELAGFFAGFYENCPVLKAELEEKRTRLALCELTGKVLKAGLELLGIETTDKM
ncbi:MAG: arginine--tRNA ligase [Verrucomicrobiales bacterium]